MFRLCLLAQISQSFKGILRDSDNCFSTYPESDELADPLFYVSTCSIKEVGGSSQASVSTLTGSLQVR